LTQTVRYTLLLYILFSNILYSKSDITLPKSFQSNFKQSITNEKNQKITYQGRILFSAPNSFKWIYTSPTKKEVCSDGKRLIVVDHDLEQVSSYLIDRGLDLSAILAKSKLHRKSVYIATYRDKSYTIQTDTQKRLSRIAYRDNLDNNILIIFEKMKYSSKKSIKDKKMKCKIPNKYDQIGD